MADNSFEFFPPRTAEGKAKLRATWQELAKLQAALLLLHLRRRRLDARRHARDGDGDPRTPATRPRRTSPASPRRARTSPSSSSATRRTASATWSRCAATCPRASAPRASSATPRELVRLRPREDRRLVPHRGGLLPRVPPADALRRRRGAQLQEEGRRRRQRRDHAVLLQRRRLFPLRRRLPRRGHLDPDRPRRHADRNFSQLARFSDACGAEIPRWMRLKLDGYRDDAASIRAFGLDAVSRAVREAPSPAARPACTSTPSTRPR